MLFNSIAFAFFMPATFVVYWLLGRVGPRWQNLFILAASCIFYGWWDWRFLLLLLASTAVDYAVGLSMGHPGRAVRRRRNTLLVVSIAVNLGMLGFFKYYDFSTARPGGAANAGRGSYRQQTRNSRSILKPSLHAPFAGGACGPSF